MTIALMCVPFAGAGATLFRPWRGHPSTTFAVTPLQLPGREEEFVDEPCSTMAEAAALCAERVRQAAGDGPFALFGHSFGALLAYETARLLSTGGGPHRPQRLIVSGAAAPWAPRPRLGGDGLGDEEFLTRLGDLVGYDHPSLHDEDLRELLLPALRADMAIHDGYTAPDPPAALPVPVSVLRGTDDSLVSRADAARWSRASAVDTEVIDLPGGHMYFLEDWKALWAEIDAIFLRAAEREPQSAR